MSRWARCRATVTAPVTVMSVLPAAMVLADWCADSACVLVDHCNGRRAIHGRDALRALAKGVF